MSRSAFPPTPHTTFKRQPERGSYDRAAAEAILDAAFLAHVGFVVDDQPIVMPMVHGRDGDRLLLHGSVASRLLRALDRGAPVCVTVTLVDGLVLAHSHLHHSVNYRSVVILGTARRVRDPGEQRRALACIVDHVVPGRAGESRPATDAELAQTMVLEVAIETASVKTRAGGSALPDEADQALPIWSGVLPLTVAAGAPAADDHASPVTGPPPSVSPWLRPGQAAPPA
ncbi:MAG TPA: pyridoxamine 5'-phosphate oxidase family protein [Acidimicrobiia bacterium]|nr:pyridoxamine 5'-phosphate oxidase family protein [Acidimicrobiia bacterium]